MRYVSGILLPLFLILVGCGGGGSSPIAVSPPIVGNDPQPAVENFDYLGVFPGVGGAVEQRVEIFAEPGNYSDGVSRAYVESVTLDGIAADVTDLGPGQIVEIHGAYATGEVLLEELPGVAIDIKRAIVGPIESVDADRALLSLLGQQVFGFDPAPLSVGPGDVVTVYGHFTSDGRILATLIEPYVGDPLFLVRGVLREIEPNRFAIGSLEVDLASAVRENFPGGALVAGDAVLVLANEPPAQGVVTAQTVRCVGACESVRWNTGLARGFLTGWRSSADFDVDGVAVRPIWCECGYGPPPPIGSYVDVVLNAGNAEIYFAPSTTHRLGLAGSVTAVDVANHEVDVLGFRVQVSPATQTTVALWPSPDVDALVFDELAVGDAIRVSGEELGSVVLAGTIVSDGSAPLVRTLDYVLSEPAIEVAGQSILTNDATQVNFCDDAGSITVADFFATAWSEQAATLLISVDPNVTPLVALQVEVCVPDDQDGRF